MGQRKEHAEPPASLAPAGLWKIFNDELLKLNSLTPLPAYSSQEHRRQLPAPQEPFWQICVAWLRYYHIQMRWDIERGLARLFHRRWGS
jgi:hypothetical protein